ncbi:hypothetical protein WA026_005598 [Henosepilachna vigintioctopunctata]|uniref:Uncharacterized protein n=1 Tax=Henosepilachna vigintioctopunctata TaxID=420089 RepID=A0AAW1U2F2_9CUCU
MWNFIKKQLKPQEESRNVVYDPDRAHGDEVVTLPRLLAPCSGVPLRNLKKSFNQISWGYVENENAMRISFFQRLMQECTNFVRQRPEEMKKVSSSVRPKKVTEQIFYKRISDLESFKILMCTRTLQQLSLPTKNLGIILHKTDSEMGNFMRKTTDEMKNYGVLPKKVTGQISFFIFK